MNLISYMIILKVIEALKYEWFPEEKIMSK